MSLGSGNLFRITDIFIDPAATQGDTTDADLKRFRFSVSTDGKTFTSVFTGQLQQKDSLQKFHLPTPVSARYIQLELLDNYGNPSRIAVAELQVYGSPASSATKLLKHLSRSTRIALHPVAKTPALGAVRYIFRGIGLKAPASRLRKGKLHDKVYNQYLLQTKKAQKASVGFRNGSVLHINSNTNITLVSARVTKDNRGDVEVIVKPGTRESVQTSTAIATGTGTRYVVRVKGKGKHKTTIVFVIEGAVLVKSKKGTVLVKTGEETIVVQGKKPTKPVRIAGTKLTAWATSIPTPDLGKNFALDSNGGRIVSSSS